MTLGLNKAGMQMMFFFIVVVRVHFLLRDAHGTGFAEPNEPKFAILCTSYKKVRRWGSYKIRCVEFKRITEHCATGAKVTLNAYEIVSGANSSTAQTYDATISVKRAITPSSQLGRVFVDVVDEYSLQSKDLNPKIEVFVQNERHGRDRFGDRKYHVVEHWFNSFPHDMLSDSDYPKFDLPSIEEASTLMTMTTVWSAGDQSCPVLSTNLTCVSYTCINKQYSIADWYEEYFATNELSRLKYLLAEHSQGPGRIYFELFWKFDVLVVPAKITSPEKILYGNVQRAVSQMRSGVPVLLEINGPVLEDFMITYNYSCSFRSSNSSLGQYLTFDEAVRAIRNPTLRQNCQTEGLRIAKEYSPKRIVARQLAILGYRGQFKC